MAANKKQTSKSKIEAPALVWPIGIVQAAEYCGMSVAALKYHIYEGSDGTGPQDLRGRMIGHSIVFEREELDRFMAGKRKPGRPPSDPEAAAAFDRTLAPA